MKTILEAMIEEHERVNEVFDIFRVKCNSLDEKSPKNIVRELLGDFLKFRWTLEKHLFIEEKAIFTFVLKGTNQDTNDSVENLLKEHKDIINFLNEIEDDIRAGLKPSINGLIDLIDTHEKVEEDSFYPKLDDTLNTEQKESIIERSKEIILG